MLSLIFLLATTVLSTPVTKINDQTLNFQNVEFVHSYCIYNNPTISPYPANTVFTSIADFRSKNLALWEFIPSNTLANNPLLWTLPFLEPDPESSYDWRTDANWNLVFPDGKIYWMYYRNPIVGLETDLSTYVFDTRFAVLDTPKSLNALDMGEGKIHLSWRNLQFGPNITSKLTISKLVNTAYVLDREITTQANNVNALDFKLDFGTYKIAIRSIATATATTISFNRIIPVQNEPQEITQTVDVPAVNKQSAESSPITVTLVSRPNAPDKFMLTNRYADNSLRFIWSDNSDNESHFLLTEQKYVNNVWVNHSSTVIPANTEQHTTPPRAPGSSFRYAIKAVNVSGTSQYSRWIVSEAR